MSMYTYVYIHIYIYNINVYLNVNVIVYVYIYITQPTPKFTKHTWREQVDRDVNIPLHPNPEVHEAYIMWASWQEH